MKKILLFTLLFFGIISTYAQDFWLSPRQFGLDTATNGISRYRVLYNTHVAAIEQGVDVDYFGLDTLELEIPADMKTIPLTQYNSFHQLKLKVTNNSKNCFLFNRVMPAQPIDISKEMIDSGDFRSIPELSEGEYLLILEDTTLWVDKRQGHNYGHKRKDILLIKDGIAENKPIMPYNTPETRVVASYCQVSSEPTVISGLTLIRSAESTSKTYLFDIKNVGHLQISDIQIQTPQSTLVADAAIRVTNVADFSLEYIQVDGTYSCTDYYGYAFNLDNIWNSNFLHLNAHANWGVFGTNNMNNVKVELCDINRFDIHCYGRDVVLKDCVFSKLYNQFSSYFGILRFEKCIFYEHTPVLLESTYSAYTPFDVVFDECIFYITNQNNYLIDGRYLSATQNTRPEVRAKNLPNIKLINSTIHLKCPIKNFYAFRFSDVTYQENVGNIKEIDYQNLNVVGGKITLKISNKDFPHSTPINFPLRNQILGK